MLKMFTFLSFFAVSDTFGQYTLKIEKDLLIPDLRVEISEDISFPDIKVKIGKDMAFEDISVGFTNLKSDADFIITDGPFPDKTILYGKDISFEDIRISAGENVSFPDVSIEIKNSEDADYLIYSEKSNLSKEEIVICLLNVIKREKKLK